MAQRYVIRSNSSLVRKTRILLESGSVLFLTTRNARQRKMQRLGITDSHYMRTRGAARSGAAPRDLDPAVNPQLTVDATHGRGSESIAGPQHDQHHPLQRTTARPSAHSASLNASPASPVDRDGSHSARSSRTALNSQRLTPSQLAFVEQVENKLRLKADSASRNPSGSGDAGAHPLISDESNKLVSPRESAGPI